MNSTVSSSGHEVIQVALGNAACEVSAHLLNLQGLAGTVGTGASTPSPPVCSIHVTHNVYNRVHVPRAILVGRAFYDARHRSISLDAMSAAELSFAPLRPVDLPIPRSMALWNGPIESFDVSSCGEGFSLTSYSSSSLAPPSLPLGPNSDKDMRHQFQEQARALAYADHSRYRAVSKPLLMSSQKSQPTSLTASKGRHVDWGDDDEMERDERDEDDDEAERQQAQQHRSRQQWQQTQYRPSQDALNDFWNNATTTAPTVATTTGTSTLTEKTREYEKLSMAMSWRDYLMPPYSPDTCIDAPTNSSNFGPSGSGTEESYYTALNSASDAASFVETEVWERIRHRLEACDSCQGLQLIESSHDVFCGWSTALLRTWQDECPHSCSWVIHIHDDDDEMEESNSNVGESSDETNARAIKRQRATVRSQVQQALILADQTELADAYLPLQLSSSSSGHHSRRATAALVGAALEGATLPFRLSGHCNSHDAISQRLALQSYYSGSYSGGDNPYGSAPNLSYREFVRTLLRQSSSGNVLELDTVVPWSDDSAATGAATGSLSLTEILQIGTSLERDQRMKQRGHDGGIHRPRDAIPGEWLNTRTSSTSRRGIMTPISALPKQTASHSVVAHCEDRGLHQHFAMSTSLRPASSASSSFTTDMYVRSIMEGMGIRYRPEQALCAVVDQSLQQLTTDGYGAGSYWPSIFNNATLSGSSTRIHPFSTIPILSVLSNSTRAYSRLNEVAMSAKNIVSPHYGRQNSSVTNNRRSMYLREVGLGSLPETDDLIEAVSSCLDLRDSYEPPNGSGLVVDDDDGEVY